jgi:uncharacterized SAM-binding protein YcdF (DUF218 family)
MIFLHKIIPAILSPVSIVLFLLAASFITERVWPRSLAVAILLVASNPLVARTGMAYLEKDSVFRPISTLEPTDTVIVLSGMVQTVSSSGLEPHYEFNGAVDRFEAAIEILNQNKAQKIIFTRGAVPWSTGKPEGEVLEELAQKRGIRSENIILTEIVQNTADEAIAAKKVLSAAERPILITSAFHMPRAQAIFARQGLPVDPYPVDFNASQIKASILDLVPQAEAFAMSSNVWREILGRAYYGVRFVVGDFAGRAVLQQAQTVQKRYSPDSAAF